MRIPDVVGYSLGDARSLLNQESISINNIAVTAPPKHKSNEFEDFYRVLRINIINEKNIDLLVCKPL
jgi:hypothetical protein